MQNELKIWEYFLLACMFVVMAAMNGCTTTLNPPPAMEIPSVRPPPAVLPSPTPVRPALPVYGTPAETLKQVIAVADSSKCRKVDWSDPQGVAPLGFIRGLAVTYHRAHCDRARPDVKIAGNPEIGATSKDALAHFGFKAGDRLRQTYSLLFDFGMQESSGRACKGKDEAAKNTAHDTCEAGAWQTSYNAIEGRPVLMQLYEKYRKDRSLCLLDVFGPGKCRPHDAKNWGSGPGVEFQALSKECPAFTAETAAVMLRVSRSHYGPINTKLAKPSPTCEEMLAEVEKVPCP